METFDSADIFIEHTKPSLDGLFSSDMGENFGCERGVTGTAAIGVAALGPWATGFPLSSGGNSAD